MKITAILHEELDPDRAAHWVDRIKSGFLNLDSGEEVKANLIAHRKLRIFITADADRMVEILSDMREDGFFS